MRNRPKGKYATFETTLKFESQVEKLKNEPGKCKTTSAQESVTFPQRLNNRSHEL
jgi:hypothetical protein